MRLLTWLVASAVALFYPLMLPMAQQSRSADKELIAVMELQPVGSSAVEASAFSDRLREELLRSGRFVMVDRSQMDAVLNEQALQQTGCTEQECAVRVGQILGVRKIVAGKVTKLTERLWQISTIMVDVETTETIRAESIQHQGDLFELLSDRVPELAAKLAGAPRSEPGRVAAAPPPKLERAAQQAPEAARPAWPLWTGWALVGVGALAQLNARSTNDDAQSTAALSQTTNDPALFASAQALRDDAETGQRRAFVLGATGGGFLAYYYFFAAPAAGNAASQAMPAEPALTLVVSRDASSMHWTWRW